MLTEALQLDEVTLVSGAKGEFSVRVDERVVAEKTSKGFPAVSEVVARVKAAL